VGQKSRNDLQRVADQMFGWPELHEKQLEAMEQVMAGRDVLAVLPTGAGKSTIYQVQPEIGPIA
jgi:ATP-dependent DNA helicase RecQ